MDPFLPFACPNCDMPSVAVGICPECRVRLVARATEPGPDPVPVPACEGAFEEGRAVYQGLPQDCERLAQRLRQEDMLLATPPQGLREAYNRLP